MSLTRSERQGLEVAGFALAEGIARASRATELTTTLVVRRGDGMQCVHLSPQPDAVAYVGVMMQALSDTVSEAALLEEHVWADQRTIAVSVWVDGDWRYQIAVPFRPGTPLRLQPERIWGGGQRRADVDQALDAVYSGVSRHPAGLRAWAAAVVDL